MECRGEVEERTGRGREGKSTQIQFYKHTKISHLIMYSSQVLNSQVEWFITVGKSNY